MEKGNNNFNILTIVLLAIIVVLLVIVILLYSNLLNSNNATTSTPINSFDEAQNVNNKDENIPQDLSINNNTQKENNNYISSQEALQVVLKSLNITENNITDLSNEIDYKYGKTVYEIDFDYQNYEYEYYVDALNGEIIKSFKERE